MRGQSRRVYLDASALVKLVITEIESDALALYLADDPVRLSSRIAAVEVRRVSDRQDERAAAPNVNAVLASLTFIDLDAELAEAAGVVEPRTLRSLDAIHLASAWAVREELDALVTYDVRLADAARAAGMTVVAPA